MFDSTSMVSAADGPANAQPYEDDGCCEVNRVGAHSVESGDLSVPPTREVVWRNSMRIIPSRFPPITLFERVADPRDLEAIYAVEAMTNARLRDQVGDLSRVPPDERVSGAGASWIMAPFTRPTIPGGRYSTRDFGAYYAARRLSTAIAETKYHRENFLRATNEAPLELDMRVLQAEVGATLFDVRDLRAECPELYGSEDYRAPQALASRLREGGGWGIAYGSVREAGGECVAIWRPRALSRCKPAQHLCYIWDGQSISRVYRKGVL